MVQEEYPKPGTPASWGRTSRAEGLIILGLVSLGLCTAAALLGSLALAVLGATVAVLLIAYPFAARKRRRD